MVLFASNVCCVRATRTAGNPAALLRLAVAHSLSRGAADSQCLRPEMSKITDDGVLALALFLVLLERVDDHHGDEPPKRRLVPAVASALAARSDSMMQM